VRVTAVEKARPWNSTAVALTPNLSQREREHYAMEWVVK